MTAPFERAARALIATRGAKKTRAIYTSDLERWLTFCAGQAADPADPPAEAAAAFREALVRGEAGYAPQAAQSLRRVLAALSRMYRAALTARPPAATHNPFDPDALQRPPMADFNRTEAISSEAAEKLLEHADLRMRAIVLLLYETGIRIGSLVGLRRKDIRRAEDGSVTAWVPAKMKDGLLIEIPERAREALDAWLEELAAAERFTKRYAPEIAQVWARWVFPASRGQGHLPTTSVNHLLDELAAKAGVPHVHPHRFRAAYATAALDADVPLHVVQANLGHDDPKTTQRYDNRKRGAGVAAIVAAARRKT